MSDDVTTGLIADLAQEGEVVDEGGFTLDPIAARTKLRGYQLATPEAYVLLLVEAAHLAGANNKARAIDFSLGRTTTATFRCPSVTSVELATILAAILGEANTSAEELESPEASVHPRFLQTLGLAVNGVLGLAEEDALELSFEHFDEEGRGARVSFAGDGSGTIAAAELEGLSPGRLRVCIEGGILSDRTRAAREEELLRTRCRYAEPSVRIESENVSQGLEFALVDAKEQAVEAQTLLHDDEGKTIGHVGWHPAEEPAHLLIVTRGVLAERIPLDYEAGFVAIVSADLLRKDLSQTKLVRDRAFHAILEAVEHAHAAFPKPLPLPKPEATRRPESNSESWLEKNLLGLLLGVFLIAAIFYFFPSTPSTPTPGQVEEGRLERHCNEGLERYCLELGQLYMRSGMVEAGRKRFTKSCDEGFGTACVELARLHFDKGELDEGLKLLDLHCERGLAVVCEKARRKRLYEGLSEARER